MDACTLVIRIRRFGAILNMNEAKDAAQPACSVPVKLFFSKSTRIGFQPLAENVSSRAGPEQRNLRWLPGRIMSFIDWLNVEPRN